MQKKSGLRELYDNRLHQSCLGGVVWNAHQSAASKCYWIPDNVDVLNVIIVKDIVEQRLGNILSLLREAYTNAVSAVFISNSSFDKHHQSTLCARTMYSAAISQVFRCQFAAIFHHYDAFSGCISSMYVIVRQHWRAFWNIWRYQINTFSADGSQKMSILNCNRIQ
jgi:hypothetical protein